MKDPEKRREFQEKLSQRITEIKADMKNREIANVLYKREIILAEEITITIPEGYTIKDIGRYLESENIVTYDEFLEASLKDYDFRFLDGIDRENHLEGYLFPDTYKIFKESTPEQIIYKMLSKFDQIYKDSLYEKAQKKGMTVDEIVTVASIIEKEIRVEAEREFASAVIYNRLKQNIALGMCSTVLYAQDKRIEHLLDEDLKIQSPYNTYIHAGLPVGPIGNPGYASIEAALNPAKSNFLYFVVDNEEVGSHFFTDQYDEFLAAKAKYNQKY